MTREQILADQNFHRWVDDWGYSLEGIDDNNLQILYDAYLQYPTLKSDYTAEEWEEYREYQAFLTTPQGTQFPVPIDIDDYLAHKDEWAAYMLHPTDERDSWELYQAYLRYRDPRDWQAKTIDEFLANPDVVAEQIDEWRDSALREYQEYRDYDNFRDPGEWVYQGVDDFVLNYDDAQIQLGKWQGLYGTEEAERIADEAYYDALRRRQLEELQHGLSPEEAARRREESYQYSQEARERAEYAAKEAYHPEVRYDPAFYSQQEALQGESVYYQDWMKRIYPELRGRFEATQPKEIGYPTREEARAAAAQTEAKWKTWLGGQQETLEQEFYGQPPYQRGERPSQFAPKLRSLSYG